MTSEIDASPVRVRCVCVCVCVCVEGRDRGGEGGEEGDVMHICM